MSFVYNIEIIKSMKESPGSVGEWSSNMASLDGEKTVLVKKTELMAEMEEDCLI